MYHKWKFLGKLHIHWFSTDGLQGFKVGHCINFLWHVVKTLLSRPYDEDSSSSLSDEEEDDQRGGYASEPTVGLSNVSCQFF